ncbi:MAG TPA: flavoprotein [Mycobacteriales bacterium]
MNEHVLYLVACGAPPARRVGALAALAAEDGWEVCVVATPSALKWMDVPALAATTGHPVRSRYKQPDEPDLLPPPDAIIVAPATSNTINKWAAGITDTLALGLVVEATGDGLPVVAMPWTSPGLAAYPAFGRSLAMLRASGVMVLFGPGGCGPRPAGEGPSPEFPWSLGLEALRRRFPT